MWPTIQAARSLQDSAPAIGQRSLETSVRLSTSSFGAGTLLSFTLAAIPLAQVPQQSSLPDGLKLDASLAQSVSSVATDRDVITVGQAIAEATDKNLDLIAR